MATKQKKKPKPQPIKIWFDKMFNSRLDAGKISKEARTRAITSKVKAALAKSPKGKRWDLLHVFIEFDVNRTQKTRVTAIVKKKKPRPGGAGGDSKLPTPPTSPPTSA